MVGVDKAATTATIQPGLKRPLAKTFRWLTEKWKISGAAEVAHGRLDPAFRCHSPTRCYARLTSCKQMGNGVSC